MTDKQNTSPLENMSAEDRAKFTVSLLTNQMRAQLKDLLLDDEFVLAFGRKLGKVLNGEPLVSAEEVDVVISEERISDFSFRVYVESEQHPTHPKGLYAFNPTDDSPAELSPEHVAQVVSRIEELGLPFGQYHWVTMERKSAKQEKEDVGPVKES